MRNQRVERKCPKCDTRFASVQSLGVCTSCHYAFHVDAQGNLLRRPLSLPVLSAFGSVAMILWLLFWFLVAPVLMVGHFISHGFTWIDGLILALYTLLIAFGGWIRIGGRLKPETVTSSRE